MATEGSQPEGDDTSSPSSNSPGIVLEIFYPYFHRVVKIRQQLMLSLATLRFLPPVNYGKEAKKMDNWKSFKIEKEIVLIMIYMFLFMQHLYT